MSLSNWNASKNSTAAPFLSEIGQTIDSTVRSLTNSNDSMVKSVLEQNKMLNETIKTITDQMREMALVNKKLAETITDVTSTNKKMIEELNTIRKENTENIKEIKSELEAVRETPSVRGPAITGPRDFVDATATVYGQQQHHFYHQPQPMLQNQSFSLPPHQQQMFNQQQQQQNYTRAQAQSSIYTNMPPAAFDQQQNLEFASYLYNLAAQQQRQQEQLQTAQQQASQMPVARCPTTYHLPKTVASSEGDVATVGMVTVPATGAQQSSVKYDNATFVNPPTSRAPSTTTAANAPSPIKPVSSQTAPSNQKPTIFTVPASLTSAETKPAAAAPTATPPKTTASSLFSGFSFTKMQTTAAPTTTTTAVAPALTTTVTSASKGFGGGIFGSSSSSSSSAPSFGQLAASVSAKEKTPTTPSSSVFAGAGQPVFGSKTQKSPSVDAKDENANDDEHEPFEPTIDFKPLVPLPALVEVKTGEEDEEVLFKERAKLYRFDQETKEFKERGLGDMKLLKNKQGRVRVLMRREQTLKLCANHYLSSKMKLLPLAKSDRAFTWQCNDFADNELKAETLAVKFKTAEMASKFKQVFEENASSAGSTPQKSKNEEKKVETTTTTSGFGDKFKKAPGSWDCPACCTNNAADKSACACCGTTKDGKPAEAAKQQPQILSGFKFSTPPGSGPVGTDNSGPKISFGFGTPKTATATTTPSAALSFGFKTPNQSSTTMFGFGTPTNSPAPSTIFGKSSANGAGDVKNDVIIVEDSACAKTCPGCMGCSMSDAEIDKVFNKIDELAKNGPQYPLEFNDDEYDDKNLMIEIDP